MATAMITGASSGLGAVFAKELAARGFNLALVARRRERLEELAGELQASHPVRVDAVDADLSRGDDLRRVAEFVENMPDLALLVNNAGFGTKGVYWDTDYARQEEMHRLHIWAAMRLTRAALGPLRARNDGAIINVSSVAGFFRSPGNVSYCATKAWMNAFTEALHLELENEGSRVQVQALCPGFTYTEFHDVMGVSRGAVPKAMWMPAEFVVRESISALERRKLYVIPGWRYKLLVHLGARMPKSWVVYFERRSFHKR